MKRRGGEPVVGVGRLDQARHRGVTEPDESALHLVLHRVFGVQRSGPRAQSRPSRQHRQARIVWRRTRGHSLGELDEELAPALAMRRRG